jgi:hypothetical protein
MTLLISRTGIHRKLALFDMVCDRNSKLGTTDSGSRAVHSEAGSQDNWRPLCLLAVFLLSRIIMLAVVAGNLMALFWVSSKTLAESYFMNMCTS